ncbi:MAG TPA: UvrD-helicase domain-containing protein [Polyangiaceae bacterium]
MIPGLSRNAVVAASAGTGKTELLTSIYLGHCLGLAATGELVSPTRIVATTFSRAAAREIRERLERRFAGVAGSDELEQQRRLGTGLSAVAAERGVGLAELRRRAARALEELPDATIDTLHNLCARILREHGLELGIAPTFAILEEQRSLEETEQIIDEVLSEALAGSGRRALGASQLLDASGGLDRLRGWMLALLSRLDDEGLDAAQLEHGDEGAAARRAEAALGRVCQQLASDPDSPRAPLARAVLDALAPRPAGLDADRLSRAFAALASEAKGRKAAGAADLKALLEQTRGRNNTERARALVRLVVEGPSLEERLHGVAEVIGEIQARLRQRHVSENRLGFGDLLRLTRDGLRDKPDVARAAGQRIELLLVDEFQDTSRVQCELLLLLRERPEQSQARKAGSLPRAADIRPAGLVVVGDRKQSIYGFRGADVSVFAELATALAGEEAARLLDLPGSQTAATDEPAVADVSTLVDSYRSDRAIIEAVNLIATRDFAPRLEQTFEIRYAAAEALRVPAGRREVATGSFTLLMDDGLTPDAEPLVQRATGAMRSALAVAGFCARAAQQGRALGSLAVLARRRATLPVLGFALDHFGVPYVLSGRDLYGTPEVRDVFAALRLSQAPRDRHALAVIARSPLGGLSDQALVELSDVRSGLLPFPEWDLQRLSRPGDVALAELLTRRLESFLRVAPRLSPRDAIFDVLERFELESVLSLLPRGAVRLANLGRLQEIAGQHGGNLAAFVRFMTRQIASEFDETEAALFSPDDDAVRLLTIHGSKGLAFPTVILADADAIEVAQPAPVGILRRSGARPLLVVRHAGEDGPIITDSQLELGEDGKARAAAERQRLSYVALTRAEHELVVALPAQARSGTLARTVLELESEGAFTQLEGLGKLAVSELLGAATLQLPSVAAASAPPTLGGAEAGAVVLGVTALSDFRICARRFSLLHLQGLAEPKRGPTAGQGPSDGADLRLAGIAAHHVLEHWPLERWGEAPEPGALAAALEAAGLAPDSAAGKKTQAGLARFLSGSYATRVRREAVRVERELSLSVTLTSPAGSARSGQLELFGSARSGAPLVVKATLDLLVELEDGSLHVIDYKRSRGGERDQHRYADQLSLYRAVVKRHFGKTPLVGLLHLLGDATEPHWLAPAEPDPSAIASAFIAARASDVWSPVPERVCRNVECGFVGSCHAKPAT